MKKFLFPFALLFAASIIFTACNENGPNGNGNGNGEPVVEVTGISLDRTSLPLLVGEDGTLTATVTPEDADDKTVTWSSSHPNIATVNENGVVSAVSLGNAVITARAGNYYANATVRVLNYGARIGYAIWATHNVDAPGTFAQNPRDAGMFFQWNRRVGWSFEDPLVNSDGGTAWDSSVPTSTSWERANDPCPEGWRVPTQVELQSLADAPSVWQNPNQMTGELGGLYLGTAPNRIFLPAADYRSNNTGASGGMGGNYWSSTYSSNENASYLRFNFLANSGSMHESSRAFGFSVRCVAE